MARKFFIEFQDRILYGADGIQSLAAYRNQWRIFETNDDCFAGPGTRIDPFYLYGLDLPEVKRRLLELHPDLDFPE